jgi:cytochrome c oxidase subunit 4
MSAHEGEVHAVPRKVYFTIFAALMVLTFVTVQASFIDLGRFGLVVALAIATVKATLVVTWFMHVKYSPRIIALGIVAGLVWFLLLVGIVFSDLLTRGLLPYPGK